MYDGSLVSVFREIGGDAWSFNTPVYADLNSGGYTWSEPENAGLSNGVSFLGGGGGAALILSDFNFINTPVPDGTTISNVGVDTRDHQPISITFHDHGDVSKVPDMSTTFGLMTLSMLVLLGISGVSAFTSTDKTNHLKRKHVSLR
jgi:hypothetical protein